MDSLPAENVATVHAAVGHRTVDDLLTAARPMAFATHRNCDSGSQDTSSRSDTTRMRCGRRATAPSITKKRYIAGFGSSLERSYCAWSRSGSPTPRSRPTCLSPRPHGENPVARTSGRLALRDRVLAVVVAYESSLDPR